MFIVHILLLHNWEMNISLVSIGKCTTGRFFVVFKKTEFINSEEMFGFTIATLND